MSVTTGDKVLYLIATFHKAKGYSPSMRELAAALQTSPSVISYWVCKLESQGRLKRARGVARSLRLT